MIKKHIIIFFFILLPITLAIPATHIEGQVLINDVPYENVNIKAHYINEEGQNLIVNTTTLNRQNALKKGNLNHIGYYFLDIYSKYNTNILISFDKSNTKLLVPSQPGKNIKNTAVTFIIERNNFVGESKTIISNYTDKNNYSNLLLNNIVKLDIVDNNELINLTNTSRINKSIILNESVIFQPKNNLNIKKPSNIFDFFTIILGLLVIAGGITIIYFIIKLSTGYVVNVSQKISFDPIKNNIKKTLKSQTTPLNFIKYPSSNTYTDLLKKMINENLEDMFIFNDEKYISYFSCYDFIDKNLSNTLNHEKYCPNETPYFKK
jgi:hypothetical protein